MNNVVIILMACFSLGMVFSLIAFKFSDRRRTIVDCRGPLLLPHNTPSGAKVRLVLGGGGLL